jgi:hypothetical protein
MGNELVCFFYKQLLVLYSGDLQQNCYKSEIRFQSKNFSKYKVVTKNEQLCLHPLKDPELDVGISGGRIFTRSLGLFVVGTQRCPTTTKVAVNLENSRRAPIKTGGNNIEGIAYEIFSFIRNRSRSVVYPSTFITKI